MRYLAIILFASACIVTPDGDVRQLTDKEWSGVERAEREWEALEEEPIGETCALERPEVRVVVAESHAQMYSLTGYCGKSDDTSFGMYQGDLKCRNGRALGAYRRANYGGMWPFGLFRGDYPLFVMWKGSSTVQLAYHEALHWLGDCAANDPDRDHSRQVFQ